MRAVHIAPLGVRITVQRAFRRTLADPPSRAVGLINPRGQGFINRHFKVGCNHSKTKTFADVGCKQAALFDRGKTSCDGQLVHIDIR